MQQNAEYLPAPTAYIVRLPAHIPVCYGGRLASEGTADSATVGCLSKGEKSLTWDSWMPVQLSSLKPDAGQEFAEVARSALLLPVPDGFWDANTKAVPSWMEDGDGELYRKPLAGVTEAEN
jgi:hypothetical protein